jgi:LPXTG-site transpeptidase (sortase) family protein
MREARPQLPAATDPSQPPLSPRPTGRGLSRRTLLALGVAVPLVGAFERVAAAATSQAAQSFVPTGASSFLAIAPNRIADTRAQYGSFGFTRIDDNTIRVQIAGRGGVPVNAAAAVLNVTMTNPTAAGFVNIYPTGTPRLETSSINVERVDQTIANLVTVRLPASGQVDMFCYTPADLVVDVSGAYIPTTTAVAAGRYTGLDQSFRVLDTRDGGAKVPAGAVQRVDLSTVVPAGASAVVVNLTVTETNGPGFWTAFMPGTATPNASNVNTDAGGQTRANQAILPLGALRAIDVFSYSGGHLVVDVAGYFTGANATADATGLFVPNAPYRALDTRNVAAYGRMYPGWVCEFDFVGRGGAQAAVLNLTTSETRGPGWFAAYAARTPRPSAGSNLNATTAGQTIANHAIARTSTAGIAVYTYAGGDVIVDVAGYFTGTPLAATSGPIVNVVPPPPPPSPLPYTIQVPSLGIVDTVVEGVGDNVVNAGLVGHWPGTGLSGDDSNHMVVFAHRTVHGGVFRYLNQLGPGDQVIITGSDGRTFTYGYWDRAITSASATAIYNAGLSAPLPSLSLVACSKTNYLPTDVNFRIVVTFTQIAVG